MKIMAGLLMVVTATACTPLFSQNIGLAHKVKRGWSSQEVGRLMGKPALALTIHGVEEWRYCSSRLSDHDEVVVLYFRGDQMIDRAFYSLDRSVRYSGPGEPKDGTCRDSIGHVYTDRREPPRRGLEIRAAFSGLSL